MSVEPGHRVPIRKRVLCFVLRVALVYTALLAVWPAIHAPYAAAFRASGNALLGRFSPTTRTRFERFPERPHQDVKVVLIADGHPRQRPVVGIKSQRIGYFPVAFALALFLATPGLRRRLWALPVGLVAIHAFVLLRVYLMLLHSFTYRFGGFRAIDAWVPDAVLDMGVLWTFDETTSSYLAALLVWTLLAFPLARASFLAPAEAR